MTARRTGRISASVLAAMARYAGGRLVPPRSRGKIPLRGICNQKETFRKLGNLLCGPVLRCSIPALPREKTGSQPNGQKHDRGDTNRIQPRCSGPYKSGPPGIGRFEEKRNEGFETISWAGATDPKGEKSPIRRQGEFDSQLRGRKNEQQTGGKPTGERGQTKRRERLQSVDRLGQKAYKEIHHPHGQQQKQKANLNAPKSALDRKGRRHINPGRAIDTRDTSPHLSLRSRGHPQDAGISTT